ncbi:baseplate J/gp47 family protein [Aquimarina brevivitae]|uniref:Baseplate J-like protein n=1 Tax=Aquimarina brevivitae TaxID=323412 RepID=A0A4Q7NZR2_9FLAO|nr:baseplate J/gp47 family protein [Aquimarina brevivitae]RZS92508.1 baseplate J-like protein [Aquimarina brevivitae]
MCNDAKHTDNIIFKRNGTDQKERYNDKLNPDKLELQDLDVADWVLFTYNFAKKVNFFEVTDHSNSAGNWQHFFNQFEISESAIPKRKKRAYKLIKQNIENTLAVLTIDQSVTPHMTLLICFLKLLEFSKERFNKITKRHLDFYYKEILQIHKLPAEPDKAHVIFELAKRTFEEKIEKGTQLEGGKDANGNKRIYETLEELIANKTQVSQLKSLYNDIYTGEIKYSDIANSLDGQGEALPDDASYWLPFGYNSTEEKYTELQDAKLGFAIASPLFNLNEGERNVQVIIHFAENLGLPNKSISSNQLIDNFRIQYSTGDGWFSDLKLRQNLPFKNNGSISNISSRISSNQLHLVFQIPKDAPAVVNYDQEIHQERFDTTLPVIRFLIKTENQIGHDLFRKLVKKQVSTVQINLDVKEVTSLQLDSDTGVLNTKKPFYPFTTQPVKGSSFIINYPEAFQKKWQSIEVSISWKNTPDSFKEHYKAYKQEYLGTTSRTIFNEGMFEIIDIQELTANQPEAPKNLQTNDGALNNKQIVLNNNDDELIVTSDAYFEADLAVLYKEDWQNQVDPVTLFVDNNNVYETNFSVFDQTFEIEKSGPLKLMLRQSFLHALFPRIYALALSSELEETLIPNDPYTPFADAITLDYTASETVNLIASDKQNYEDSRIKLFHEGPFGQYEEHTYLKVVAKEKQVFHPQASTSAYAVPDYCHGGELFIGLKDAEVSQQVALLFQILEGSENPAADSFKGNQKIEWYILCNNHWKNLETYVLKNNIDNFLTSGIVKFSIPKQATKTNTRLPEGLIWLKAKMHKSYDAVCKVIDIKAQAVLSQFVNKNNELGHLNNGLPVGTIAKLVERLPQIKKVEQPFNSFDGKPEESDDNYYRRISERLRHKNRAVTLWDYEHLIMQQFNQVFRVKCLNHTSNTSFISPGDVTVVVIPDIIDKNVFDIYEPRLSTATLNKIQNYINQLNSMQVEARVINPLYEQVIIKVSVKFYQELDENFYKKQLDEDLIKFLSPWAFDTTQEIVFGVELNRSMLIDYVEKLAYVDYLVELEMAKHPEELETPEDPNNSNYIKKLDFKQIIAPASPKHILVSAKKHIVSTTVKTCVNQTIEEAETCQY